MHLSRRSFLELSTAAAFSGMAPAQPAQRNAPNILFLLADDHRADALGCMGNEVIHTPHLDRLAGEGVLFRNHFATTPICCASRASIMLGQYAGTHGIYDFATPLSGSQAGQTYWMRLKQAGYRIGFVGKFGVGNTMPSEAFDVWNGFGGQGHYFPNGPAGPHLTHILRDQANDFLRSAVPGQPFCLSVSFKAPHVEDEDPRQYLPSADTLSLYEQTVMPPPRGAQAGDIERFPAFVQRSENRRRWAVRFATPQLYQDSVKGYYRLVSGIDSAVASMRETLRQQGLEDNTIIVYSADHGIFNGEHGLAGKWYPHEEAIRIPLIVYDPRLPAGARGAVRRAMTLNIDLSPTVLDLAGVEPPPSTQGRSLAPLLQAEQSGFRNVSSIEHHFPYQGWIPSTEGMRTQRWKYIRYTDSDTPCEELYDLAHDPAETRNLVGRAECAREHALLAEYWKSWRGSLHGAGADWREPVNAQRLVQDRLS